MFSISFFVFFSLCNFVVTAYSQFLPFETWRSNISWYRLLEQNTFPHFTNWFRSFSTILFHKDTTTTFEFFSFSFFLFLYDWQWPSCSTMCWKT
jgi:hypothetical protein